MEESSRTQNSGITYEYRILKKASLFLPSFCYNPHIKEDLKPGIDYIGVTTPFYCNDEKGNFVMLKRGPNARDEQGAWDFGGEAVEQGESLEECALRGVREEYGTEGLIQEQVPAHSIIREKDGITTHWIAIPFFVKVDIKSVQIMEPHKFTEIGVFDLDNLPEPLHSGVRFTMETYPEYFDKYRKSS